MDFLCRNIARSVFRRPEHLRTLVLYVTYRCNLRCRMCGIWSQEEISPASELSLQELDRILDDKLFSRLEHINLNGGEPNLREDLVDIAALCVRKFPGLKALTLNSNGLPPRRTIQNAERLALLCHRNRMAFSASISLHRVGPGYDEIAGMKNAHAHVAEALLGLSELRARIPFALSVNCVITGANAYELSEILGWSRQSGIPVNFALGEVRERFFNLDNARNIEIGKADRPAVVRFLRLLSLQKRTFRQHALRYKKLADMIECGKARSLACHYALAGAILGSDGQLYYCPKSRALGNGRERKAHDIYFDPANLRYRAESLFKEKCPHCPPYTFNLIEVEKDLLKLIGFFIWGN
jgi:MoaA/NifB/PqqE/SkfB family radical SAM enzyme